MDWLLPPLPISNELLMSEAEESEVEPGKKGGLRGKWFCFRLCFLLSNYILTDNKLIFLNLNLFCLWQ